MKQKPKIPDHLKAPIVRTSKRKDPILKTKKVLAWYCNDCQKACWNISPEAKCICNHRLREHNNTTTTKKKKKCSVYKCPCKNFFYIFSQGVTVLRCKCKHKHTDHDPVTMKCKRRNCTGCEKYESPWVCNCNHRWNRHKVIEVEIKMNERFLQAVKGLGDPSAVERGKQKK